MVTADDLNRPPVKRGPNKLLIGCLGALIVVFLLGVAGYFYVKAKIVEFIATEVRAEAIRQINASALPDDQKKALVAVTDRVADDLKAGKISLFDTKSLTTGVQGAVHDAVGHLDLPEDQKQGIVMQVDRVADGYKDDLITDEQLTAIMSNLAEGPFAGAILVWGIEAKYVFGSSLSETQQQDASLQLRRALRGYAEGTITDGQLEPHLDKILEPDPANPGERRLKEHLPADEFMDFIAGLESEADAANVPDEHYQLDFAGELKKAIDAVIVENAP